MDVGIGLYDEAGNLIMSSDVADGAEAVEVLDTRARAATRRICSAFSSTLPAPPPTMCLSPSWTISP